MVLLQQFCNKTYISESQSFIFTSSMGGTLYIKPLDLSSQDLEKLSLDGIIDSMCDYDNSYTYAMGGWSKPLNLSTLCNREKHTQTNGSQTPPNYDYMLPQQAPYHVTPPPHPGGKTTKNNSSTYPRLKCGTTQEDMEARRFVQEFKTRRVAHKLTQSDIGERLNRCTGARYGQSYISRLESMQLSTAIVLRMKPLLNRLLNETENGMFAEPGDGTYHAPLKKRKSNSGSSKSRKNAASQRNAAHSTQFGQEIDDMVHKPQFSRSASMPTMANNTGHWQGYHQQNVQQNPAYQAPHNASNFFITGLMSSLNPGVPMSTSRADGSSCNKSADPMGSALSHSSQLYNPYRMDQPMVEPKHEVIELSPVHPRPPHPSPAHDIPHSAFSPNIHELGSVKSEPQITTLHPPLKPG